MYVRTAIALALTLALGQHGGDTIKSIHARAHRKPEAPRIAPHRPSASHAAHRAARPRRPAVASTRATTVSPPLPPTVRSVTLNGVGWTLRRGSNIAEAADGAVRLAQRAPKPTTAYATAIAPLQLYGAPVWYVRFEVRFGALTGNAGAVRILGGGRVIAAVEAGAASRKTAAYVATAAPAAVTQRTDGVWHACQVVGNAQTAELWLDGVEAGAGAARSAPDAIYAGPASGSPGEQTEVFVRNVLCSPSSGAVSWMDLFDGRDLVGWSTALSPWRVSDGVVSNTGNPRYDALIYDLPVNTGSYVLSMRVRVMDGMRFRIFVARDQTLLAHLAGIWIGFFGPDGGARQITLYGLDLANVKRLADASFEHGRWYDLRLECSAEGYVTLFVDDRLVWSATRTRLRPVKFALSPGDDFSPGHIQVASVRLLAQAPARGSAAR